MSPKKARLIIIIFSGLFLLTDQILKFQAFYHWTTTKLIFPYFGWQLFLNKGVAFGLPLSNIFTILITLPMIGLITYLFYKNLNTPKLLLAWSMLLAGSISNLLDRIIYHQVIDYFLIGTAIINLGDVLIVGGLVIYLFGLKTKKVE
ncbi:MAG: Lipoprotein signal peptidase [Parcubacteria group bacterium Gr01-1014_13]|nr:MAG: Lipoprotein signal peptidase [Parcubacteria group bacterium Gr01-1014_13]